MDVTAIVHIGSSKAGSSSLQDSLLASRAALLAKGVLVPTLDERSLDQFALRHPLDGTDSAEWHRIRAAVDEQVARHRPRAIVFSSEHFWARHAETARFEAMFRRWADRLRLCLYLREPAAYYLSSVQQRLKATHDMPGPDTWLMRYRQRVQSWRSAFGEDLQVFAFQPSSFPEGFVENFAARFLSPFDVGPADLTVRRSNESLSAEVVSAMQLYHLVNHPGEPRAFTGESRKVRLLLQRLDEAGGGATKLRLKPEYRSLLIARHAPDLAWLGEAEGLAFDGIDYAGLPRQPDPAEALGLSLVSEIAEVDPERRDALLFRALKDLAAQVEAAAAKSARAAAPDPPPPSGLARFLPRRFGRG